MWKQVSFLDLTGGGLLEGEFPSTEVEASDVIIDGHPYFEG